MDTEKDTETLVSDIIKPVKVKKSKARFFKPFMVIVFVCFIAYSAVVIISQQAQIAELKKQTEVISQKITEAKQQNDEYNQLINSDEDEYMEKMAINKLGYAYPNERRFYLVNGSKGKE